MPDYALQGVKSTVKIRNRIDMMQAKLARLVKPVSLVKLPGRYLAHQEGLPHLPVPPLQQTLDKYLLVLKPLVPEEEWDHTRKLVEDFRTSGVGERLQKGLERRAKKMENWPPAAPYKKSTGLGEISNHWKFGDVEIMGVSACNGAVMNGLELCMKRTEGNISLYRYPGMKVEEVAGRNLQGLYISGAQLADWWLQTNYLENRLPVVVHVSPGVVFPKQDFADRQGQLRFAAKLVEGVLDFKSMIDNETLPVEHLGGKPLCINQYYQILSSCRIPGPKRDSVVNYSQVKKPPTHITVVHNFQFFELDVYNSDGSPLTADQIFNQLEKICGTSLQTNKEPIGILTSNHRNSWAKAYNNLIKDKTNKESVRSIQKSIFTVCLDGLIPKVSDEQYKSRVAAQMLHGGGSRLNSGNRWFDKILQFIVLEDGSCGLVYEHAPAEGPTIVALLDHVIEYMKKPDLVRSPMIPLLAPKKLRFNITPEIKKDIEKAKQNLNIMVHNLDIKVFVFEVFGRNFPKAEKLSPDAFIQVALQLAYFRMYGRACATCAVASLRLFRLGRSDVIRSASVSSLEFVQGMEDSGKQNLEKVDLLRKAVQGHRAYTNMAISGNAIDRHLLGLKLQAIKDLVSIPEIFMDTSYAVAMHFNLATSQVPTKTGCIICFGKVVPDGYGVCYNPMENRITFSVSAFNSCAETNAARMAHYLERALCDMQQMIQSTPKSKL